MRQTHRCKPWQWPWACSHWKDPYRAPVEWCQDCWNPLSESTACSIPPNPGWNKNIGAKQGQSRWHCVQMHKNEGKDMTTVQETTAAGTEKGSKLQITFQSAKSKCNYCKGANISSCHRILQAVGYNLPLWLCECVHKSRDNHQGTYVYPFTKRIFPLACHSSSQEKAVNML